MLNVWRVTINHSISDKLGGSEFYCYSCGDEIWSSHHMPTPSHHHQAWAARVGAQLSFAVYPLVDGDGIAWYVWLHQD